MPVLNVPLMSSFVFGFDSAVISTSGGPRQYGLGSPNDGPLQEVTASTRIDPGASARKILFWTIILYRKPLQSVSKVR